MNDAHEPIVAALFAHLQASATLTFTATSAASSPILTNVSTFAGFFAGLPVFGLGVPRGAVIQSMDAVARTLTLSSPVSSGGLAPTFTTGFLTTGRRVQHWSQVSDQPALFLRHIGTTDEFDHDSLFSRTSLECEAWIYSDAGKNPNAAPDVMLNHLVQMVRQSFAPDGDYGDPRFTLAGLAYWCRIEGRSDYSPGDQGGQALARIPIRITLP